MIKRNVTFVEDGKTYEMEAQAGPFDDARTIVGIGLSITGLLLATYGGWKRGVTDLSKSLMSMKEK